MHKKNDVIELKIESLGLNGEGIAHVDGQVVFVAGGLPEETCKVLLLKVGKSAIWGKAIETLTPSPDRVDSDCDHFPKCGGCQLRHMSYDLELSAKAQRVNDALRRIGGVDMDISEIYGATDATRYRNKVQLPVSGGETVKIGFFRPRTHDVVDVEDCLLQPNVVADLREGLLNWMNQYNIPAYNELKHKGFIRHLYVRFSQTQVLCCIIANARELPYAQELVDDLRHRVPSLAGVVMSTNQAKTNVVLGKEYTTLWGQDYLDDTLCGLEFRISVPSFYQVNHAQTEVLYGKAVEFARLTGKETVLDLYCGIGSISLVMAKQAGKVIGAEIIPSAVEDAGNNAKRNGITNAEFICADASEIAQKLADDGMKPDVICVDPPRKGLAPDVCDSIAKMAPERVVYVSCDPATLARDIARFRDLGYGLKQAVAVDMFPRTAHIESVAELVKL